MDMKELLSNVELSFCFKFIVEGKTYRYVKAKSYFFNVDNTMVYRLDSMNLDALKFGKVIIVDNQKEIESYFLSFNKRIDSLPISTRAENIILDYFHKDLGF